jgi:drug/metabolite transporter (DMT)-like permease
MRAILGGFGAACCFATTTLCASRAGRLIPPSSVLAWAMVVGLAVTAPALGAVSFPDSAGAAELGWLAVSGFGNVIGLLLAYSALRVGKVGVVAPILATEGALAAVLSVVAGEPLERTAAVLLAVTVVGVVLAAVAPDPATVAAASGPPATVLAALAATLFGVSLFATGHVSASVPLPYLLVPPRLVGVLLLAVPLWAGRRLRLTRRAVPLVVTAGLCEVCGFGSYALGARHGLAVAAVLASQFAGIAAVAAFVLFRERLTRLQIVGVSIIVLGVSALSAVRA